MKSKQNGYWYNTNSPEIGRFTVGEEGTPGYISATLHKNSRSYFLFMIGGMLTICRKKGFTGVGKRIVVLDNEEAKEIIRSYLQ